MATNQELTTTKAKGFVHDALYVGENALIITDQKTTEPVSHRSTGDKGLDQTDGSKKWIEWGDRDDYPNTIEDLNSQEPVSSRCLEFKIKANIGQGLFWYRKIIKDGKEFHEPVDIYTDPACEDIRRFCEESFIDEQMRDLSLNFEWWKLCYTELVLNAAKTKVHSMRALETSYCRAAPRNNRGEIPSVFVSSKFGISGMVQDKDVTGPIPIIDKSKPFKHQKAIYRHAQNSSRRRYYPKASWHSTFGALDLALEAFKWIRANLNNSKHIKYMIRVPWNYFTSRFKVEDYKDRDAWIAAIKEDEVRLYTEMDNMLAGSENAMKSFKTKYGTLDDGTVVDEFHIDPIDAKTHHEAWLPLYDTTTAAICSGHGVSPVLASIIISSTMGANSGSTIREYFNFYTQFETSIPRQVILEPLLFVKKANKWPQDIYPGFKNIILETLDNNKSGTRTEGEGNPTTTNKES